GRLMLRRIPSVAILTVTALMIGLMVNVPGQPPPPGKKADKKGEDKKGKGQKGDEIERFSDRLDRLRRQLEYTRPPDQERQTLLWNSGVYANKADQIWKTQQPYIAD